MAVSVSDVLSLLAIAGSSIGIWYANRASMRANGLQDRMLALEHERDRRSGPERRAAVATALLAELEALDVILTQVAEYRQSSPLLTHLPRMDVLERTADYVDLLSADTVRSLIALNVELRHAQKNLEMLEQVQKRHEEALPTEELRMKALDKHEALVQRAAYELGWRTHRTRELLVSDGGVIVELRVAPAGDLSQLPPPPQIDQRIAAHRSFLKTGVLPPGQDTPPLPDRHGGGLWLCRGRL